MQREWLLNIHSLPLLTSSLWDTDTLFIASACSKSNWPHCWAAHVAAKGWPTCVPGLTAALQPCPAHAPSCSIHTQEHGLGTGSAANRHPTICTDLWLSDISINIIKILQFTMICCFKNWSVSIMVVTVTHAYLFTSSQIKFWSYTNETFSLHVLFFFFFSLS